LVFGQLSHSDFDKECFLLGTLDDYMGHQQTFTVRADTCFIKQLDIPEQELQLALYADSFYYQCVDSYFQQEKSLALLIDSLFSREFPDLHIVDNGSSKGIKLYSASLSNRINNFYDYSPSGRGTIYGDTIYVGCIKADRLKTTKQKLSFLAGAFLRNGGVTASQLCFFSIPNSQSKAALCAELLKELDCRNVVYDVKEEYIPVGHWVYFEPSETVIEVIRKTDDFILNLVL
jgi:hypothetical protein